MPRTWLLYWAGDDRYGQHAPCSYMGGVGEWDIYGEFVHTVSISKGFYVALLNRVS